MRFKSLRKKRKEKEEKIEMKRLMEELRMSKLEEICGEEKKLYEVLSHTLFLNPSQLEKEGIEPLIERAKDYENKNEKIRARITYHILGSLALYHGNLELVQKYFSKCEELSEGKLKEIYGFFLSRENAEKALKFAQEYYRKVKPIS